MPTAMQFMICFAMELEASALIEDYYFINEDQIIEPAGMMEAILVDPFCVEGSTIFDFRLALTIFA